MGNTSLLAPQAQLPLITTVILLVLTALPHIIEHNAPRLSSCALLAQLSGPKKADPITSSKQKKEWTNPLFFTL